MKAHALIYYSVVCLLPGITSTWMTFHQRTSRELCGLGCECPTEDSTYLFLDCSRRRISKLPSGITFDTTLMKVSFQGNNIGTLQKGTFYRAESIEELDLSLNGLSSVSESLFMGFSSLAELNLAHNQLASIPPGFLEGLESLRILQLGNNRLENIPGNLFEPTKGLQELRLRYNNLKNLREDTFRWLPALERLDLENTGLLRIPTELFQVNLNLNWLSLADNSLKRIPTEAFRKTTRLSSLDLSGNLFDVLPAGSFTTLRNLSHLTMNHLSRLTTIDKLAFHGMKNLKSLSCSYNERLSTIHPEAFGRNATIPHDQLFLHNNDLKTLNLDFADLDKMSYVDLRENPWTCDCKMLWMAEAKREIQDSVRCKNPVGLRDQPLSALSKEQLICTTWLFSTTLLLFAAILAFTFCMLAAAAAFCPRSFLGLRVRSKRQFQYSKVVSKADSVDLEWDPTADV